MLYACRDTCVTNVLYVCDDYLWCARVRVQTSACTLCIRGVCMLGCMLASV